LTVFRRIYERILHGDDEGLNSAVDDLVASSLMADLEVVRGGIVLFPGKQASKSCPELIAEITALLDARYRAVGLAVWRTGNWCLARVDLLNEVKRVAPDADWTFRRLVAAVERVAEVRWIF
jgi:hypothetical protein